MGIPSDPSALRALACLGGALALAAVASAQDAAGSSTAAAPAAAVIGLLEDELLDAPRWSGELGRASLDELAPADVAQAVLGSAPPVPRARWFGAQEERQEPERWSSFLPLMKEEALARGYELPLPFGAGITTTILTGRDIEVTDLRIGVNGGPLNSVSRAVDLGSESDVFNANVKLDVWLLPFLNLYTLLGYVYNESKTQVHVSLPRPGGGTFDFDLDVDSKLDGFVGGGGLTLAAGYEAFFLVLDSNYSQTDIGFDDSFRALTASMRAGYQSEVGGVPLMTWLGGAYWDTENVAKGHANVAGVGRVDFEADQGPTYPWLLDLGANARFAPGFEFFFDFATDLHGGIIATVGPVFRF